jgi:hypothetical protein
MIKEKEFKETKYHKKKAALATMNIAWLDIAYLLSMIMGILAKEVWDNINETGAIDIKPSRLIAALIVSPIIYAAIYSKLIRNQLSLLGLAVAFQNGFFWQAVFQATQKSS